MQIRVEEQVMILRALLMAVVIGVTVGGVTGQATVKPARVEDVPVRPVQRTKDGPATTQPAISPEATEAPADSTRSLSIQETIALLNEQGLMAVDRTAEMDHANRAALRQSTLKVKAAQFSVIDVEDCGVVLALHFLEAKSWVAFTKAERTNVRFGGTVLLPTQETTAWNKIRDFGYAHEGQVSEPEDVMLWSLLANIPTLNAQVTLYQFSRGGPPDLVKEQWKPLLDGGFIERAPFNPLADREVATKVIALEDAGKPVREVSTALAGWVWSKRDGKLYPTGDPWGRIEAMDDATAAEGGMNHKIGVLKGRLGGFRGDIATFYADTAMRQPSPDQPGRYPTLAELATPGTVMMVIPRNPINGSREIQAATWDKSNPIVHGTAGWNYDEKAGKLWANTAEAGANKL